MKALLKFLQSWRRHTPTPCTEISKGAAMPSFELLTRLEQEAVQRYFYAAAELMGACNNIRYNARAMDLDEKLIAFRNAEQRYVEAGFEPFFPPAVRVMREFSVKELERAHLLHRLQPDQKAQIFSPSMTSFVRRLAVKCKASLLHSSDYDHLMNPQS